MSNLNLAFVHDHRFVKDANGYVYTTGSLNCSVWQRYLEHFNSKILVVARQSKKDDNKNYDLSTQKNVKFFLFDSSKNSFKLLVQHFAICKQIKSLFSKNQIHAVIARLPSELSLSAIRVAKASGIPYAVEVAGCPWDGLWNYGNWKGKLYAPVMTARTRRAVAHAPFSLYVTKEFLQRRYPNYNGRTVACSNVEIPEPCRDVLDQRLQKIERQERLIVLGLIGTLKTRFKGIQTVLEALEKIRNQLPSIEFRILGGGDPSPWKKEAEQYGVSDVVIFEGTLPGGKEVFNWLDNVDIYLQPSFKEGLPRALIEAMSRGCPAIGSNCAGIPELLDEECLIKPADADYLSKLIFLMAQSKEWQKNQAVRNWETSQEYAKDRLDARRDAFWKNFAKYTDSIKKGEKISGSTA